MIEIVKINFGYRCIEYNQQISGTPRTWRGFGAIEA